MIGGTVESNVIPILRIRGGFFEIFRKNEQDLNPSMGHISPVTKDDKVIGYKQSLQYVTGKIVNVNIQKRFTKRQGSMVKVTFIDVELDSGGTSLILEFPFTSSYGKAFASSFRNVVKRIGEVFCFRVWQDTPEPGNQYGRINMVMYPGLMAPPPYGTKAETVRSFFVRHDFAPDPKFNLVEGQDYFRSPKFEKEKEGSVVFDGDALDNYIYKDLREVVYSVFGHYEKEDGVLPEQQTAPPVQQPQYQQPQQNYPPPGVQDVPPAAQNYYQSAPPPATQQQTYHHAGPLQSPVYAERPQREVAATPPVVPSYNAPVVDVVAPVDDRPIVQREYRERVAPPVHSGPPAVGNVYNPNAGMSNRPTVPSSDSFEPLGDDDLPF